MVDTNNKDDAPAISIIMPTLNAQAYVAEALLSVVNGNEGLASETIIVDGGSGDDTIEIAGEHSGCTVHTRPGLGIYDSINFAVSQARAPIIGMLNADDYYLPGTLSRVVELFDGRPLDMATGDFRLVDNSGKLIRTIKSADRLSPDGAMMGIPAINARFYKRDFFEKLGGIRSDLGLAGDREFVLRLALSDARCAYLDRDVYAYRQHEGSRTISGTVDTRRMVAHLQLALAEELLRENILPPHGRLACKKSARIDSLRAISRAVTVRDWPEARSLMTRLRSIDEIWPRSLPWTVHDWRTWRGRSSGY